MRTKNIVRAAALTAILTSTSGCAALAILMPAARGGYNGGPGQSCSAWGATAPSGQSGEATALAAVVKAAAEQHAPTDGWLATTTGLDSATYSSGTFTIHVQRLPDGTWLANSGSSCGEASMYPPSPTAPAASATPAP